MTEYPEPDPTVGLKNDTYVVGDSLTYFAKSKLQALRPNWDIDGMRGREIDRLNPLLERYINDFGQPRQVVIALGTNEGEGGFTKDVYERAVAKLLDSTRVVFVTTYRDAKIFGEARAEQQRLASEWMDEIARGRQYTAIAPWRRRVVANPELVWDGVHATEHGEQVWADIVHDAMFRAYD